METMASMQTKFIYLLTTAQPEKPSLSRVNRVRKTTPNFLLMFTKKIILVALFAIALFSWSDAQLFTPAGAVGAVTNASQNVGVGKDNPSSTLEVYKASNPSFRISNSQGGWGQIGVASCNACFAPVAKTGDVVFRSQGNGDLLLGVPYGTASGKAIKFIVTNTVAMTIFDNERVGIGTTNIPAAYKLAVADGIITEKVKVAVESSSQWADFVFDEDYQLQDLEEVEAFIQENKHLPNVPSADQVVEEGVNLGEMDATLLRKVEELTLYVIELKKENRELAKKVEELATK